MTGERLTSGTRGRSLCLWTLCDRSEPLARCVQTLEFDLDREPHGAGAGGLPSIGRPSPMDHQLEELVARIGAVDIADLATEDDPLRLLVGLSDAVDSSTPWQPPDTRDVLAALSPVRAALVPTAQAICAAPAAQWWRTPIDLTHQYERHNPGQEPANRRSPARQALGDLRDRQLWFECHTRQQPVNPADAMSGEWWSFPGLGGVRMPSSSRRLPGLGAVELAAEEDSLGADRAGLRHLRPSAPDPRVFEVHGPDDWARLVSSYPFDVSRSRRGTWWQSTGIDGSWFLPDWSRVADEWDAVHVSVHGYLTTAGEPVPVPGGHSVLTGWSPDCTFWLCDVVTSDPEEWVRIDEAWYPA